MKQSPRPPTKRLTEQFTAGQRCAARLVGLTGTAAQTEATASGFESHVIGVGVDRVAADLRPDRVRLVIDPAGIVTDAWAG